MQQRSVYGQLRVQVRVIQPRPDEGSKAGRERLIPVYNEVCEREQVDMFLGRFIQMNPGLPIVKATWTVNEDIPIPRLK